MRRTLLLVSVLAALVAVPGALADGPATSIFSAPAGTTTSTSGSISFGSSDPVDHFVCHFDGSTADPCSSPFPWSGGDGSHGFSVEGVGPDSSVGPSAGATWTVDATPPVLSLSLPSPSPITVDVNGVTSATVSYSATATDGGSSLPVSCNPAGTSFSLGTTSVGCSATDGAGNTASAGFSVTVQDTTPPVLTLPSPITASVDGATSQAVTYSATASDGGNPLTPSCSPASGAAFPLGTTSVSCSVTDAGGNSVSGGFTVTVQDTTAPSVSITSSPSGTVNVRDATIAFTTSDGATSCQMDGGGFSPCSSPAALSGLGDGAHSFVVQAVDGASNSTSASASWSVDATPPALALPGSAVVVEADGPTGGNATYTATASDNGAPLLPGALSCSPRSGAKFPLGDTSVECTASDTHGNVARGSFHVVVRDTTPPAINAPNVSVTATSTAGIRRSDSALADYLAHVSASDLVSTPKLVNDAPDVLAIGQRTITFTATDAAGNRATRRAVVTVLPVGAAAPAVDQTPPANPTRVTAKAGDGSVVLTWKAASDVAYVAVTAFAPGKPGKAACRGTAGTCKAAGLRNGTAYRFVLVAWDRAGNRSKGVVVRATPKVELLKAPQQNQRVQLPPTLRWAPVAGASYYNVQLWRGKEKVLSTWPAVTHLKLARQWTYDGKKRQLQPGTYTWYVWPGLGSRAAAKYGPLLGSRTFVVPKGPAL